ncbi:hypothetical protein Tco_0684400 [Tanacetum coccineum]
MYSGSLCEVIYEHCFLKLKPSIQASKVDSQVPLVGFSGGKSWAIGEVLLEITIGDTPLSRSETLNFVIVRSNSPYNMLLGRIAMQKIGMVVSTIHGAIKFHTTQGIRTVFSKHESDKIRDGVKKIRETSSANTEGVLSCTNVEEKIIVNNKYPEQTVTIGKQLPEHFKERDKKQANPQRPVTLCRTIGKVESLSEIAAKKCFLDAYKGYHHIQMVGRRNEDKDNISCRDESNITATERCPSV